ncbi:MAG: hypothetical protein Q9187_002714 [Circinaria calcarea]
MAQTRKPTILLVAGAWLRPATYEPFLNLFKEAGYSTLSVSYPSFNPTDPHKTDVAADSRSIRENVLHPLVEEDGKEVVIIMHSYGGMPGSVAAKGLGEKQRRKEGKLGGVLGLIFITAFVIQEGASVADGQGGNLPPWVKVDDPRPGFSLPMDPVHFLSADIAPAVAKKNAANLEPHATLAFKSPSPAPAWADPDFEGRLAYIVCTEDEAIVKAGQEAMMQYSGQHFMVKELQGSHMAPFLLKSRQTAEMVTGFIKSFRQADDGVPGPRHA